MSKQREALEVALSALELATTHFARDRKKILKAQQLISEALAEPGQEPALVLHRGELCHISRNEDQSYGMLCRVDDAFCESMPDGKKFYTSPQPREWQELSDFEVESVFSAAFKSVEGRPIREINKIYTSHISAALRAKNEVKA